MYNSLYPHMVEEHNGQHFQPFPEEEDRLERKEHSTKERLITWAEYGWEVKRTQ